MQHHHPSYVSTNYANIGTNPTMPIISPIWYAAAASPNFAEDEDDLAKQDDVVKEKIKSMAPKEQDSFESDPGFYQCPIQFQSSNSLRQIRKALIRLDQYIVDKLLAMPSIDQASFPLRFCVDVENVRVRYFGKEVDPVNGSGFVISFILEHVTKERLLNPLSSKTRQLFFVLNGLNDQQLVLPISSIKKSCSPSSARSMETLCNGRYHVDKWKQLAARTNGV